VRMSAVGSHWHIPVRYSTVIPTTRPAPTNPPRPHLGHHLGRGGAQAVGDELQLVHHVAAGEERLVEQDLRWGCVRLGGGWGVKGGLRQYRSWCWSCRGDSARRQCASH